MTQNTRGRIWIGTSNVELPGNKSTFPMAFRDKSRLHYYSSLFNSVELNSTFYKVPLAATFKKWGEEVNPGFRFSVKLWKGITHVKELRFNEDDLVKFVQHALCMQERKGCLLLQFPGKISLDYFNQVEDILRIISDTDVDKEWKVAVEFRNDSWQSGEAMELLDEYKASLVLHDYPKGRNEKLNKKAPVMFMRFHGPTGDYRGSYSDAFLAEKAKQIKTWLKKGKDVYAYFNNTVGDAYQNAYTLKALL